MDTPISSFVKEMRKMFNLTQVDLVEKSGVGLRFVRDLEQGNTLRLDKVNQVAEVLIKWLDLIDSSFLPDDFKRQYKRLIIVRMLKLR